jgi:hypothetical protein
MFLSSFSGSSRMALKGLAALWFQAIIIKNLGFRHENNIVFFVHIVFGGASSSEAVPIFRRLCYTV